MGLAAGWSHPGASGNSKARPSLPEVGLNGPGCNLGSGAQELLEAEGSQQGPCGVLWVVQRKPMLGSGEGREQQCGVQTLVTDLAAQGGMTFWKSM